MHFSKVLGAALLLSGLAFSQTPIRVYSGAYASGPFVPLVTTPEISLQTAAPASVGASDATYGLVAGARNSTFDTMNDNAATSYTEPVWYSGGGAPAISPQVSLEPRPLHAHREMHMMMREHHVEQGEEEARQWTYFGASDMSNPIDTSAGKNAKHATRTITNDDIERANQNTGTVKYNGKTEKLQ
jgi:hypothetical protein